MFTHILIGTNDPARAKTFYDFVLGALGTSPGQGDGSRYFYLGNGPAFAVGRPASGEPCSSNGVTIGFAAASEAEVDAFHANGLALGATSEGSPGPRQNRFGDLYAAYLRDLDGNKICAIYRPTQ